MMVISYKLRGSMTPCVIHTSTGKLQMPMKKIHVEFELDPDLFMKMLQHGSSNMKISVYGDEKKAKLPKEERKLLDGPKPKLRKMNGGAKGIIMEYAKLHQSMGFSSNEVIEPVVAAGYSK